MSRMCSDEIYPDEMKWQTLRTFVGDRGPRYLSNGIQDETKSGFVERSIKSCIPLDLLCERLALD